MDILDRAHMKIQIQKAINPGASFASAMNPEIEHEIKMRARALYTLEELEKRNIER